MSWWGHYRGQSNGRLLYALYTYCDLDIAEQACCKNGFVYYRGNTIAAYRWENETTPHFDFVSAEYNEIQFIKKPYLDSPLELMYIAYIVQEVRHTLKYTDALWISELHQNGQWSWLDQKIVDMIKEKINQGSHGRLVEKADQMWHHVATAAVFKLLKAKGTK